VLVIWALGKFLYTNYITDKMEVQRSCSHRKIVYINYAPNVSLFTLHVDEISASWIGISAVQPRDILVYSVALGDFAEELQLRLSVGTFLRPSAKFSE
jgi:hypothetical protein